MKKYIDADKLIAEIERRMEDCKLPDGRFPTTTNIVRYEELSCLRNFITSLQQEQPDFDDVDPKHLVHSHYTKVRETKTGRVFWAEYSSEAAEWYEAGTGNAYSISKVEIVKEQPEVQNGKFVFPKYLYARTKDNKTIDMSYAPQDMTAIEYIRNDFVQQEQLENEEKIMNFFDAVGDCGFSQHDILLLNNIWKKVGCQLPKSQVADSSKMEQPEVRLEEEIERIIKNEERFMKFQVKEQLIKYVARHFAEWGAIHLNARKEE